MEYCSHIEKELRTMLLGLNGTIDQAIAKQCALVRSCAVATTCPLVNTYKARKHLGGVYDRHTLSCGELTSNVTHRSVHEM